MSILNYLFKVLVHRSECAFIRSSAADNLKPFRVLETKLNDGRHLKFSVMRDRRKTNRYLFNLSLKQTFLVKAEIHKDLPEKLTIYNNIQFLTINVPMAFLFNDRIIGEVLLHFYLDKMISDLSLM